MLASVGRLQPGSSIRGSEDQVSAAVPDGARLVAEAEQQGAQDCGEVVLLVSSERGEDASFVVDAGDDGAVDELAAGGREGDDDGAPVGRIDVKRAAWSCPCSSSCSR